MSEELILLEADRLRSEEFLSRQLPREFRVERVDSADAWLSKNPVAAYFLLSELNPEHFNSKSFQTDIPVFINALNYKLGDFSSAVPIAIINGWPGFLGNEILEISFSDHHKEIIEDFLTRVNWKFIRIADQAGLALPRIIAMIVNEACFAVAEKVSTPDEIDLSMKIGTSYPYGPFEWSRIIGPDRIISLLDILAEQNERYRPAPGIKETLSIL